MVQVRVGGVGWLGRRGSGEQRTSGRNDGVALGAAPELGRLRQPLRPIANPARVKTRLCSRLVEALNKQTNKHAVDRCGNHAGKNLPAEQAGVHGDGMFLRRSTACSKLWENQPVARQVSWLWDLALPK